MKAFRRSDIDFRPRVFTLSNVIMGQGGVVGVGVGVGVGEGVGVRVDATSCIDW